MLKMPSMEQTVNQDKSFVCPEHLLHQEFLRRKSLNVKYSIRAFAKSIGVTSGRICEYFSGKRKVTLKMAHKISLAFKDENQRQSFIRAVEEDIEFSSENADYFQLQQDHYEVIAEWHHYAILNLIKLDTFIYDSDWIATRLGITKSKVENSINKMLRLELIKEVRDNSGITTIIRNHKGLTTTEDIPSEALKEGHRQNIQQSLDAIDEIDIELRDISSITMAVNPKTINKAKEKIRAFRREMQELMEEGNKEEVYNLNIQLIPLTDQRRSKQ